MDSFKKPEMILSIANTLAIIGISAFGYKKVSAVEDDLKTTKEALAAMIKKVGELTVTCAKMEELLNTVKQLDSTVRNKEKNINRIIKESSYTAEDLDDLRALMAVVVKSLKENGFDIKLKEPEPEPEIIPSRRQQKGRDRREKDRRSSQRVRFEERQDDSDENSDDQIEDYRSRRRS